MRYYDIVVTHPNSSLSRRWTSYPNGQFDPGAWNVEFDMFVAPFNVPAGGTTVTVHGVALDDLKQSNDFMGAQIQVFGGMGAGLPLAKPQQGGQLFQGTVFQSFGNWRGTEMTLDFVVYPSTASFNAPANIVLNWTAGTPLEQALEQTFNNALPGVTQSIQISPDLVNSHDDIGQHYTFEQLAQHVLSMTKDMLYAGYPGVSIALQGGTVYAYDGTVQGAVKQIDFHDLVGQPTWLEPSIMQFATVMRADVSVYDTIQMPQQVKDFPGFVHTAQESMPDFTKHQSIFQGQFQVISVRHIGNFRSPNGEQWVTVVQCAASGNG